MNILNLIKERKDYPVKDSEFEFKYIAEKIDDSKNKVGLALPYSFLLSNRKSMKVLKDMLFDSWYISAIFDLSMIWRPYSNIQFILLILEKSESSEVLFSQYKGNKTFKGQNNEATGKLGKQKIENEYKEYIKELEEWLRNKENIKEIKNAKTYKVNYSKIDLKKLHFNYYDPELINNEEELRKEETKELTQLADILIPKRTESDSDDIYSIRISDFNYPLKYNELSAKKITDIKLKKGDILISRTSRIKNHSYLIYEKPRKIVTPSQHLFVIRPKSKEVSSEYLFLYLQSDTAQKFFLRHKKGTTIMHLPTKELSEFPIIIPDKEVLSKSKAIFSNLYLNRKEDKIETINRELFKKTEIPRDKAVQKELIEEFLQVLKLHKREMIDELIKEDLKELENCYKNKNYKSCLVLSGSILEAILLDWLSEIEKKDYYNSDDNITLYKIIDKLGGHLDNKSKDKAHSIRRKRNWIHPKAYLNSQEKIDKKICREVLDDLKLILNKRGLNQ